MLMKKKKKITIFITCELIVLVLAGCIFPNTKNISYNALKPLQAYEKIVRELAEGWDPNASLILVWGVEYNKEGYIFPDILEKLLILPIDFCEIEADNIIGDGKAPIWCFIFYSPSKQELCEIRTYLTTGDGWKTSMVKAYTPFNYTPLQIKLKDINYLKGEINVTFCQHLLWRYNQSYDWLHYTEGNNFTCYSQIAIREILPTNLTPVYIFTWEAQNSFLKVFYSNRDKFLEAFKNEINNLSIIILPDYGDKFDWRTPTWLTIYNSSSNIVISVHYPNTTLKVNMAAHQIGQNISNISLLALDRIEENITKKSVILPPLERVYEYCFYDGYLKLKIYGVNTYIFDLYTGEEKI